MASSAMVGWRDHDATIPIHPWTWSQETGKLGEPMPKAPRTIIDTMSAFKTASHTTLNHGIASHTMTFNMRNAAFGG
jgi:hypothetical protein